MLTNVYKWVRPDALDRGLAPARIGIGLVAFVPFLTLYFSNLWKYCPHYEFFPLVLVVTAWLLWKRWPQNNVAGTTSTVVTSWVLLWAGVIFLGAAVLLFSPWLAAVGSVVALGGLLMHSGGRAFWPGLLPVWLLFWLTIRPPWRLDDASIHLLQSVTADNTSRLLDWVGVLHVGAGNVFQLPSRELFVAEACSGVHSQLILFAATAIWVVVERRTWLHSILLLLAAVFWSVTMNTLRVTAVVYAAAQHQTDLSTGRPHESLGAAVVLVGFLLILCTDRLLAALLAPVLDVEGFIFRLNETLEPENVLARLWNRLVTPKHRLVFAAEVARRQGSQANAQVLASTTSRIAAPIPLATQTSLGKDTPHAVFARRVFLGVAFALAILQILALRVSPREMTFDETDLSHAFDRTSLPVQCGPWQRGSYQTKERELRSDQGRFSHIWQYSTDSQLAHVSVDFPFLGWHELTRCYQSRGWTVVRRSVLAGQQADSEDVSFVEVDLCKPTGEVGLLQFSLTDGTGRPVTPQASHWQGLRGKLASNPLLGLWGETRTPIATNLSTLQIQQFLLSDGPLDDRRHELAREQFLRCRTRLYGVCFPDREGRSHD